MRAAVIAVLGAESTGKTQLCEALARHWTAAGRRAVMVGEVLREFCVAQGRTPRQDEQLGIALEQSRRIEAAAEAHELVVADTTALMPAIYSRHYFSDHSLMERARAAMRIVRHSLVMGLDLPWVADGIMREGAHMQARVDADVRQALGDWGLSYSVISGRGPSRCEMALAACEMALRDDAARAPRSWRWVCADCDDSPSSLCELHERRLLRSASHLVDPPGPA